MSDLATFGGYARTMATAQHKPECEGTPECVAERARHIAGYRRLFREDHPKLEPLDRCPGCIPDSDCALWTQIADEIEAHLGRDEDAGLFA